MNEQSRKILFQVLWIAGVLASAVLIKRFDGFASRAPQAEAKNNLSHIYTLQMVFHIDNKRYGNVEGGGCNSDEEIGFKLQDCARSRYQYSVQLQGKDAFVATAREKIVRGERQVFPGCDGPLDEWRMNQERELVAVHDAMQDCAAASSRWRMPGPRHLFFALLMMAGLTIAVFVIDLPAAFFLLERGEVLRANRLLAFVTAPLFPSAMLLSGEAARLAKLTSPGGQVVVTVLVCLGLLCARYLLVRPHAASSVRAVGVSAAAAIVAGVLLLVRLT